MLDRRTYVGRCVECGALLFYNEQEEKLVARGGEPGCLHHYDWPEDREGEEEDTGELLKEIAEEGEEEWRD